MTVIDDRQALEHLDQLLARTNGRPARAQRVPSAADHRRPPARSGTRRDGCSPEATRRQIAAGSN